VPNARINTNGNRTPKQMPTPSKDDFAAGHLPNTALKVNPTKRAGTVSQLGIFLIRQSSQPAHPASTSALAEITTSFQKPLSIFLDFATNPFYCATTI